MYQKYTSILKNMWSFLNAEKCPGNIMKTCTVAEFLTFSDNT